MRLLNSSVSVRPYQLELKETSLQEVLRNVTLLFEEEASSQNIRLQAEINSNLPLIKMDAPRLTQAFINIMKNGMQAMERGGSFESNQLPAGIAWR